MAIIKTKFNRGIEGATNIVDAGTEGTKIASGTTAQRGSTVGHWRFNSTNGKFEGRDANGFKELDSPPTIANISPTTSFTANQNITITGTNFQTGVTVKFIGNDGTEYASPSVTLNSDTQITAQTPNTALTAGNEPYDVRVSNSNSLSSTLVDSLDAGSTPTFSTASGSLGSVREGASTSFSVSASDADSGQTVTYALQSGSLPSGYSLNTSTGAITGTAPSVGSDTTSSFTIRASAGGDTTDRAFSIIVKNSIVQTFNYTGSGQTFTVPSGVTSFTAYMWGAGGSGGSCNNSGATGTGGAGGAGGYVTADISNYSAGQAFGILVGQSNTSSDSTVINSFGGGGNGGGRLTQRIGGSGGGRSEINIGSVGNTPNGTRILVAGAGGGGNAVYQPNNETAQIGGVGGNPNGGNGTEPSGQTGTPPTGGTQSAGGNAGTGLKDAVCTAAISGVAGIGGHATGGAEAVDTNYAAGAGGGGGYYGGGGGDGGLQFKSGHSGGGGSSYANASYATSITYASGSGATAPQTGNTHYSSGIASGGAGRSGTGTSGTAGGHGKVVIVY